MWPKMESLRVSEETSFISRSRRDYLIKILRAIRCGHPILYTVLFKPKSHRHPIQILSPQLSYHTSLCIHIHTQTQTTVRRRWMRIGGGAAVRRVRAAPALRLAWYCASAALTAATSG